ncbi:MAG: hypothetical protein ACLURP_01080 [Ruminococcus sp.]
MRATNEKGKTQDAFDYYVTDEGKQYGMRCIYVTEDGPDLRKIFMRNKSREAFRNEWKYLISTSEKKMLMLAG